MARVAKAGPTAAPCAWACALLLLVSALARGPYLLEPPGRDQSLFLCQAELVLDGAVLYRDVFEHKPPGVVALYASAMTFFGRSYLAIQALHWISGLLGGIGIWWLFRRATGRSLPGLLVAACYLPLHGGLAFGGFWGTAQPEAFMDPPLISALLLLLLPGDRRAWRAAGAGFCVGLVILLKYSALPLLLLAGLGVRGRRFRSLIGFAVGAVAPLLLLLVYLLARGALEDFWRSTVVFNALHRQASATGSWENPWGRLIHESDLLAPLYLLGGVAVLDLAWRAIRGSRPAPAAKLVGLGLGLWIVALAQVFWQAKFWVYHYEVTLLPLCLLAGGGLDALSERLARAPRRGASWLAVAIVLAAAAYPHSDYFLRYERYHGLVGRWTGRVSEREFHASYRWGAQDYDYAENIEVAGRIARETGEGERLFVWGFEPGLYTLSGRPPASRFLYDYPLMPRFTAVHGFHLARLMEDLRATPPSRLVVYVNDANSIEPQDSLAQLRQLPELERFVRQGYRPLWQLGDARAFGRVR